MKKYRVTKTDGTVEIIEATNMENAISIARNKFGLLPNDVNTKISDEILRSLLTISKEIKQGYSEIHKFAKEYEWEEVYRLVHSMTDRIKEEIDSQINLAGSMVKIDKEDI